MFRLTYQFNEVGNFMGGHGIDRFKVGRYETVKLKLTTEQADFLDKEPNASELIRRLIDTLMETHDFTKEYLHFLDLKTKLKKLNSRLFRLNLKRSKKIQDAIIHFKGQRVIGDGIKFEVDSYLDDPENPEPIDEEGYAAKRVLDVIDAKIMRLEKQIAKVKDELLR
jgi:hypothetical protein